jgi:hypothetical protein
MRGLWGEMRLIEILNLKLPFVLEFDVEFSNFFRKSPKPQFQDSKTKEESNSKIQLFVLRGAAREPLLASP